MQCRLNQLNQDLNLYHFNLKFLVSICPTTLSLYRPAKQTISHAVIVCCNFVPKKLNEMQKPIGVKLMRHGEIIHLNNFSTSLSRNKSREGHSSGLMAKTCKTVINCLQFTPYLKGHFGMIRNFANWEGGLKNPFNFLKLSQRRVFCPKFAAKVRPPLPPTRRTKLQQRNLLI